MLGGWREEKGTRLPGRESFFRTLAVNSLSDFVLKRSNRKLKTVHKCDERY